MLDILALTEWDHRRYQQIAASVYPIVLVLASIYLYTADPQTGIGAGFVLIMAIMTPIGAAFFAASLVIILNGLYTYQGGSVDRVSLAVAIAIVGGLAPSLYLGWTMAGTRPLWLMAMYVIFGLGCPLGLVGVAFDIFSRASGKVSNAWTLGGKIGGGWRLPVVYIESVSGLLPRRRLIPEPLRSQHLH